MDQLIQQLQQAAAARGQVQHPHGSSALQLYAAAAAVNMQVSGWSSVLNLSMDAPNPEISPNSVTNSSSVYMIRQMALIQQARVAAAAVAMQQQQQQQRDLNRELGMDPHSEQRIKLNSVSPTHNIHAGKFD